MFTFHTVHIPHDCIVWNMSLGHWITVSSACLLRGFTSTNKKSSKFSIQHIIRNHIIIHEFISKFLPPWPASIFQHGIMWLSGFASHRDWPTHKDIKIFFCGVHETWSICNKEENWFLILLKGKGSCRSLFLDWCSFRCSSAPASSLPVGPTTR